MGQRMLLTLWMLGNFSCLCCHLLPRLKKKSFSNTIRVSNGLDPDQDRQNVHPDLGPKMFAKFISRQQITPSLPKGVNSFL